MTPSTDPSPQRRPLTWLGWAALAVLAVIGLVALVSVGVSFRFWKTRAAAPQSADPVPSAEAAASKVTWYCSMTQCGVRDLPAPGKCPKCGMDLIPTEDSGPPTGPREYAFSEAARRLVRVATAPAERRAVSATVDLPGKVAVDETRRAVITARFAGRLERLYVDHTGVTVRAGDHMADIYAPDLIVSQVSLLAALRPEPGSQPREAAYAALSKRELDDARRRLRNWGLSDEQIAQIEKAGKPVDTFTINAPLGGVVVERMATRGQYVSEGTPLFAIGDLSRVWVELSAFESDLAPLRFGQTATVAVPALPGTAFSGTVAFIDPLLDEKTRSVRVRLDVPNPGGALKPGMLVKARLEIPLSDDGAPTGPAFGERYVCPMHPLETADAPASCPLCGMALAPAKSLGLVDGPAAGKPLVVPVEAPLSTGRRTLVYVEKNKGPDTLYEAREVTLGVRAGPWRVVTAGLEEGERVATRGAFQIDSAMQIQGKFSLMALDPADAAARDADDPASGRDPYFGPGVHDGDPQPGWYAAATRSGVQPRAEPWRLALDPWFTAYLPVAAALAQDDDAAAGTAAQALAAVPTPLPPEGAEAPEAEYDALVRKASDAIRALSLAEGLPARRLAFRDVSGALTQLARRYGAPAGGLRLVFCPMAFNHTGAFWLQTEATVSNPYHGLEMPRCGWEVEKLD